ncbi:MAG: metallophosphoesterase [Atribacterota bacterium]
MLKLNHKKPIISISLIITLILLLTSCSFLESQESLSSPIIIYGDSRTNHQTHQKIVNEIIKTKPAIVFHTGDLVEDGLNLTQWATFNQIVSGLMEIAEFYPALGNHENNSPLYFDNFDLPHNERWYSVEKDNFHFIVLDSNSDCSIGSEKYFWLEDDLQNINENIKFVIAIFHHPPFSTGPHAEDEKGLRQTIIPLFEQYGIDIVFNGHDHDYERSFYNDIYYIVTGGGGAPLYDQARTSPYSQLFIKVYHFCKLTLTNNQLIIEVYDIDSNLIDQFVIN